MTIDWKSAHICTFFYMALNNNQNKNEDIHYIQIHTIGRKHDIQLGSFDRSYTQIILIKCKANY